MKLKTLAFVLGAAVSGLVQAATGGMPDTVNIVYVKAPFNLQNMVMKDRQMLEKAFKPYGTEVKWHTITSGAKQGQAMAAGAIDVSAVMNTASLLMTNGAGNPVLIANGVAHPADTFAIVGAKGEHYTVKDLKGKKIGIPNDYFGEGINAEVAAGVKAAAQTLKDLGAEVEEFDMPIVKYAIPTYYIIACAEACSNLSRFDGIKYGYKSKDAFNLTDVYFKSRSEGFGMEVKKRIMLGNFVLSSGYFDAYYKKALQAKGLICKAFNEAFQKYDFLLGPVAPTTALKMGEGLSDPLAMYLGDIYTVMINIAGLPSLALPCGFDTNSMPIGMQLIGKPFDEKTILSAGYAYQNVTDWHKRKPNL